MKDQNEKRDSEYDLWFIGGIIAGGLIIIGGMFYTIHRGDAERETREAAYLEAHPRIHFGDFVKLTRMNCRSVKEMIPKTFLRGLDPWYLSSTMCRETYSNFNLRTSLIRHKQEMFMVYIRLSDKKNPAEILELNVPYCVIATDLKEFPVKEKCGDI